MIQRISSASELLVTERVATISLAGASNNLGILALRGSATWELEDLAQFHNVVFRDLKERTNYIDNFHVENREIFNASSGEVDEASEVYRSRMRETVMNVSLETQGMRAFSEQSTVILCWSFVEKYSNRLLTILQKAKGERVNNSHRWHQTIEYFKQHAIDIRSVNFFENVNECRELNNTIKHSGIVGTSLRKFEKFKNCEGKKLETLELDVQRYYTACAGFVGELMFRCSEKLDDGDSA